MTDLKNKKIAIVAHVFTTVPFVDLEEYLLLRKVKKLLCIEHPLMFYEDRPGTSIKLYDHSKLKKHKQFTQKKRPFLFQYIFDSFVTIYWIIKFGRDWDIIIALNNLNAISALLLKLAGVADKVIYYTIDFTPQRFSNKYLNNFYHYLDKIAVQYSHITWNVSPRIAGGREKFEHFSDRSRQIVVPNGMWTKRIKRLPGKLIKKHSLVYAGGFMPHQGIQLVLAAIPEIVKKIPDFKFYLMGIGTYEGELRKLVDKLKIGKYVEFLGYFDDLKKLEELISECQLGVAMYSKELDRWNYYSDPCKIKSYLACGVPVLTTPLTYIAEEIEKKKCGFVLDYKIDSIAKIIIALLKDEQSIQQYRKNAFSFSKKFDVESIYDQAFASSML